MKYTRVGNQIQGEHQSIVDEIYIVYFKLVH